MFGLFVCLLMVSGFLSSGVQGLGSDTNATWLSVSVYNSTVFCGDDFVLSAELLDTEDLDDVKGICGEKVYCWIENSSGGVLGNVSGVSGGDGVVSLCFSGGLNLVAGDYSVFWEYNGSSVYGSALSSGFLHVILKPVPPLPVPPLPVVSDSVVSDSVDGSVSLLLANVPLVFLVLGLLFVVVLVFVFRRRKTI
jgi:hypothetical protein